MNRTVLPLLALTLLAGTATMAQTTPAKKMATGYTYEVSPSLPGQRVVICTQEPVDEAGNVVGKGNMNAQSQQIIKNIRTELAKKGMTLKDVKQVSYRIKGSPASAKSELASANTQFTELKPGITDYFEVASFLRDGMLLEVEVIAVK